MAQESSKRSRVRASNVRRRRRRTKSEVSQLMESKLQDQLQTCIELETKIARLKAEYEQETETLLELMEEANKSSVSNDKCEALYEQPTGRSTTTVNPAEYSEMVDWDDFISSIRVNISEAKKHLSEKELQSISETTPGNPGKPRVKLRVWGVNAKK